ncbi:MAG: FadR family transcriptional regulator [Frankiales bacterium]|nr:FadR family transcriptional regulator [Frankiales bacterium]
MSEAAVSLAPLMTSSNGRPARAPKTAELVAQTLRKMIVGGKLKDGDFLPHEAELMAHFNVSRPTLREAVRVLESERLVEVRRGSRTGARVCVPGPEVVARPAGLLLELAGATVADVFVARSTIEPAAARLVAEAKDEQAAQELEAILVDQLSDASDPYALARGSAAFHLRVVQLSGNVTLGIVAGMLHEITERHTRSAVLEDTYALTPQAYRRLIRSYEKLIGLIRSGDGSGAETHWRRHMDVAGDLLLQGRRDTRVQDVLE